MLFIVHECALVYLWSLGHDGPQCEGWLGHGVGHLHLVGHDLALGNLHSV